MVVLLVAELFLQPKTMQLLSAERCILLLEVVLAVVENGETLVCPPPLVLLF